MSTQPFEMAEPRQKKNCGKKIRAENFRKDPALISISTILKFSAQYKELKKVVLHKFFFNKFQ